MDTMVDFSKFINRRLLHNLNIYGPYGAGKTSYLRAVQQYNDDVDISSLSDDFDDRHFIIALDFSDYSGKTYEEAICYFRKKMSELYVFLYEKVKDELGNYTTLERYLDVEEGVCGEEKLRQSLVNMVRLVRYGKRYRQCYYRPLILIDEISRPILYASKYNYADELGNFYDDFLDIDHYEMTAGIITTSYAPVNTDVDYDLKYIRNVPVNMVEPLNEICIIQGMELEECVKSSNHVNTKYFEKSVTLEKCFEEMMINSQMAETIDYDYDVYLSNDMTYEISNKRIWISVQKTKEREANIRRKQREKREYAEPLAWGINIPSKYAGIRKMDSFECDPKTRNNVSERLKVLYEKHGVSVNKSEIYEDIQYIGVPYNNFSEIRNTVAELKSYADAHGHVKACQIDVDDEYWAKINVERDNGHSLGDMSLLKLYVSVKETKDILDVFDRIIRFLIDEGKDLFHAKVSIRERNDHICLWISNEDFYRVEAFMSELEELLYTPLEFVPYRGKIGITREFFSWSSYNSFVAEFIALYLQNIMSREEIDVIDMLAKYVRAWNGDFEESNSFTDRCKASNAQELIILLESFDVIMGNGVIDARNILLNGDGKMWCALGESKNWHEVGVNIGGGEQK